MENNKEHIDDFLDKSFDGFESAPDPGAWDLIADGLQHLEHPIDLSINQHLSDLSAVPDEMPKPGILAFAALGSHPIDIALDEKLSILEAIPDRRFYQEAIDQVHSQKRKKRRFVLWFMAAILLISGLVAAILQQIDKVKPREDTLAIEEQTGLRSDHQNEVAQNAGSDPDKNSGISNINKSSDKSNNVSNNTNNNSTSKQKYDDNRRNYKRSNSLHFSAYGDSILAAYAVPETVLEEDAYISPLQLQQIYIPYEEYSLEKVKNKHKHPLLPKKRLSPFSINVQLGYANESATSQELETRNIHKDALPNFREANGHSRNGDIISINFGYRLGGRFMVKSGFQYSSTLENSRISFIYNEVPYYDSDSTILFYFVNPPATSPQVDEKVKTTTHSLSVPVQFYAKVFELKKLSLWAGLGSDLVLQRTIKGKLFSFEDEDLRAFETKAKNKISPHISLLGQYHLTPGWAVTANIQGAWFRDRIQFDDLTFVKRSFMPSLRLGILYTPIIPAK